MKFRTTLILFAVFLFLLVVVFLLDYMTKDKSDEEEKLVGLSSDDVQKITFKKEDGIITFLKDEEGEWLITVPIEAKADKYEVNRLAEDFSELRLERVVEEEPEDLSKYNIPQQEITLWYKDKSEPLKILIGMENPLDSTFFAKREDESRIVLIPGHLKSLMEKKVFDFRQKDVFRFVRDEVRNIKLRAKQKSWEVTKKEDEWHFEKPIKALAEKSKIDDILDSLSNLKAKEFISEEKSEEELKEYKLDEPEYEIILGMPLANQEVSFILQKNEDKIYATTSLSSKIISAEDTILSNLEKETDELREKEVADFYSWEAHRVYLKKERLELGVLKDEEDKWRFETPEKEAADGEKITKFIRKMESLEAEEFIDPPLNLKDFGLDNPQAEIKIWTKEDDDPEKTKEIAILVGSEDKEAKKVVVKNAKLDYLFQVNSEFLEEFPKDPKDWQPAEKSEEKKENKGNKKQEEKE
ncbi:MAG: DUF4340 domain-containing protein [Candidatus Aminicenantes bacterium]|nr:DUF4340 domain-containing protein [Candidatus Aminicenantes bacterium]